MSFENIVKIKNTPLSISVYAVKDKPLNMHEAGTLEIIFCLTGTIKFAYAYEEFTLNAGEYETAAVRLCEISLTVERETAQTHS